MFVFLLRIIIIILFYLNLILCAVKLFIFCCLRSRLCSFSAVPAASAAAAVSAATATATAAAAAAAVGPPGEPAAVKLLSL